jgi:excinuclease ABC subunit B
MVLRETAENQDVTDTIKELESEMQEASSRLEFEKAALIRDQIRELKRSAGMEVAPLKKATPTKVSYQTKTKKRRSVQLKKTTRNTEK